MAGIATYYCRAGVSRCMKSYPDTTKVDLYAAAGPALRAALGPGWRGTIVTVASAHRHLIRVKLIDWCACGGGHVIDLYWDAFQLVGNPVRVSW